MRLLAPETVQWLAGELGKGGVTRVQLARGLCEREAWRNQRGELCVASASKGLRGVSEALGLELPRPRQQRPEWGAAAELPRPQVEGSLAELGRVELRRAQGPRQRALWRRMLRAGHPQGEGRAPGARVTYLIHSERHGVVGGLSFVAAGWHCGVRDRAIGWSARARVAHLAQVVNNDRFLLLEGVRVAHLASHVLGRGTVGKDHSSGRRLLGRDGERAVLVRGAL